MGKVITPLFGYHSKDRTFSTLLSKIIGCFFLLLFAISSMFVLSRYGNIIGFTETLVPFKPNVEATERYPSI